MRLKDKVALITGGTSGIGKATVELFMEEGCQVAFTGRRVKLGKELSRQTGAYFMAADHRLFEDCQRTVYETLAKFGRIDILFNNAGIVVTGQRRDHVRRRLARYPGSQRDSCVEDVSDWCFPSCAPREAG